MSGLAPNPAFVCFVDELSLELHNLSSFSLELVLKKSTVHSTAHMALTETAPGPQRSRSLHGVSSPSATTLDTAFFSQAKVTQSLVDHSIFVANYMSVTSNEVVIDDDEMDNFLPETQWTTSHVVSPIQPITVSPPGLPRETSDSMLTPSLPIISSQDEDVTSAWQDTMQQPTTCAECPSRFSASGSGLLTSQGLIPTPPRTSVLSPVDPSGHLVSRTLPEVVVSGTEGIETLLYSSVSSVPQPLGGGITQQPFPLSGEASAPPEDALATGADRFPDVTTAVTQSLKEITSPRTSAASLSQTALAFRSSSSTESLLFSPSLVFASFSTQSADASYNSFLPSTSREASALPGYSVVPSHVGDPHRWSPAAPFRPHPGCVSCTAASPGRVPSVSLAERDVGSGDGAATLSVTVLEASGGSPLSSVLADFSEFEEEPQEFNTLFPSRPVVPLPSRSGEIASTSAGLSAEADMSSVTAAQVRPARGRLSVLGSLDTAAFGTVSVVETQVMLPSLTAGSPSVVTSVLLDSPWSVPAKESTPTLPVGVPAPVTSAKYSLDLSVESPLFLDREPAGVSQHETGSALEFASSFLSTPRLELSSVAPSPSQVLALASPRPGDVSAFTSRALPTPVETFTPSDSASLQSAQLSVPDATNRFFSQLWPSSDLILKTFTSLPGCSEVSLSSGFPSDSPTFSGGSAGSLTEAEAHLTSAFTETTSYFEFSLMSHESAVTTLVPSSSDPILDVLTAGTHVTSLLTAFHTTPILTESSLFSTPAPSDGGISTQDDHTSVLSSFSKVVPPTTVLVTTMSLSSASSFVSEVIPSPVPTEPTFVGPSFTPTDLPMNTSTALSTSNTSAAPHNAVDPTRKSRPASQNPHESSTALARPSLPPATPSPPDAVVDTPALVTKPPYVCDITVPDAYLITTGKALRRHLCRLG